MSEAVTVVVVLARVIGSDALSPGPLVLVASGTVPWYMSCNSLMTEVSPTVSRKKKFSTVEVRIMRRRGIERSSRPNLVGCLGYLLRT